MQKLAEAYSILVLHLKQFFKKSTCKPFRGLVFSVAPHVCSYPVVTATGSYWLERPRCLGVAVVELQNLDYMNFMLPFCSIRFPLVLQGLEQRADDISPISRYVTRRYIMKFLASYSTLERMSHGVTQLFNISLLKTLSDQRFLVSHGNIFLVQSK